MHIKLLAVNERATRGALSPGINPPCKHQRSPGVKVVREITLRNCYCHTCAGREGVGGGFKIIADKSIAFSY